jgi:hypothetical protein
MRSLLVIVAVSCALVLNAAHGQDLNGSFTSSSSGEAFEVQGNGDGTAEIYGSDGRHVGTATDNGDGTWDINSAGGRYLGQVQDEGDGSFDVSGSQGGYWGSGSE